MRIKVLENSAQLFRNRSWITLRLYVQRQIRQPFLLRNRQIEMASQVLAQVVVGGVFHHSDNGDVRHFIQPYLLANDIRVPKEVPGKLLIDQDDVRTTNA